MIEDNLRAIELVKKIDQEQYFATEAEKEILKKFNGWGAMWQIFKPDHKDHHRLKALLTPEEFEAANDSILNAYYTDRTIVRAIWDAVKHLGFVEWQKVLEPSCGIGYFIEQCPNQEWVGVELEPIAALIARELYLTDNIYNHGFEKLSFPDDHFDLAISNVPFGNYSVFEPRYDGLLIHNHFISKCIDLVRPDGIVALITSTGTMDSRGNREFRRSLASKATLVSAMRLPSGSFANAKTSVTSDLLIFKKVPEPQASWIECGEMLGFPINQYFIDNPYNLFGTLSIDKLYGGDRLALENDGIDVPMAIAETIEEIQPFYKPVQSKEVIRLVNSQLQNVPVNAFANYGGQIYQRLQNTVVLVESGGTHTEGNRRDRIKANLKLLEVTEELLDCQADQPESEVEQLRAKLNSYYEEFKDQFGLLSGKENKSEFGDDPRYGLLASLDMGGKKAEIFYERTTKSYKIPDQCDSPKDALLHCLNVSGKVDLGWISARC